MNAHPELMSKPVLVSLVKAADVRIAAARAETERMRVQAEYWRRYADEVAARASTHRYDPILETERAQMMLDALGPDPDATAHAQVLDEEVEAARRAHSVAGGLRGAAKRVAA